MYTWQNDGEGSGECWDLIGLNNWKQRKTKKKKGLQITAAAFPNLRQLNRHFPKFFVSR